MKNTPNNLNETTNSDNEWSVLINDNQDGDDKTSSGEKADEPEELFSSDVYQKFGQHMFDEFTNELQDSKNQNPVAEALIENKLAVVFPIMGMTEGFDPITPTDFFENIEEESLAAAESAREKGHTNQAHAFELQAAATDEIKNDFYAYIAEQRNADSDDETKNETTTAPTESSSSETTTDKIA